MSGGLKFSFPATWSMAADPAPVGAGQRVTLEDAEETLNVEIYDAKKYFGKIEDFVKNQKETPGTLVNEGLAQIPNVEAAWVKVWEVEGDKGSKESKESRESQGGGGSEGEVIKLQFYLFDKQKVAEILVWPVPQAGGAEQSPAMAQFNGILASIKIE